MRASVTVVRRLVALLALLAVAGCGGSDPDAPSPGAEPQPPPAGIDQTTTTDEGEPPAASVRLVVYLLLDGRVHPVARDRPPTKAVARAALETLFAGPTAREREVGLSTDVPATTMIERLAIAGGVASVDLRPCPPLPQVVFTLTQFPTVEAVTGSCAGGRRLTRTSFEDAAPAILVESPLLDQEVASPLRLGGSANTFEATFQVDIVDAGGRVVAQDFVTATSGSGTRGTFEASLPFDVERPGGKLVVYEASAEDGSRLHEVEIPLQLQP